MSTTPDNEILVSNSEILSDSSDSSQSPRELVSVHFSELHCEHISLAEKVPVIIQGVKNGEVLGHWQSCLYNQNSFIVRGCEMYSKRGISKQSCTSEQSLTGIISNTEPDQVHFKSVIEDCVNNLQILAESELQSLFLKSKDVYHMEFKLLPKKTKFYDQDGNIIEWQGLRNASLRFIPTFCISRVYLTSLTKKVCITLREATILSIESRSSPVKEMQPITAPTTSYTSQCIIS